MLLEMEKVTITTCLRGNMHSFFEKGFASQELFFPKAVKNMAR